MDKRLTRKELSIIEQAVSCGYRDGNLERCIDFVMELFERNVEKKLYRFRPPEDYEIEALLKSQISLCRPRAYEDLDDCK